MELHKFKSLFFCGFICALLCSTGYAQQWTKLNTGSSASLIQIFCPTADVCYAIGENGTILKTTNGGTSWTSQNSGTSNFLVGLHFTGIDTGYICGEDGILLKTTDGGDHWTTLTTSPTSEWTGIIHFLNGETGFLGGGYSTFWKTTDGGNNWSEVKQTNGEPSELIFVNDSVGMFGGGNSSTIVYRTTDGGNTWNPVNFPGFTASEIYAIDAISVSTIFGMTGGGDVYISADTGATWQSIGDVNSSQLIWGADFIDALHGFALTNDRVIYQTVNGGSTWTVDTATTGDYLHGMYFPTNRVGFVVGNAGAIWKWQQLETNVIDRDAEAAFFTITPNPFNDWTQIEFNGADENYSVVLYNAIGEKIYEAVSTSKHFRLNRGALNEGSYFLQVTGSEKTFGMGRIMIYLRE